MQNYIVKKMTPEESKRVDRDLLELFIADYQPFRIVEDKGFKKFVKNITRCLVGKMYLLL